MMNTEFYLKSIFETLQEILLELRKHTPTETTGEKDCKNSLFHSITEEQIKKINSLSDNTFPMDYDGFLAFLLPSLKKKDRRARFDEIATWAVIMTGPKSSFCHVDFGPGGYEALRIANKQQLHAKINFISAFEFFRRWLISQKRSAFALIKGLGKKGLRSRT
jgi:hypothetical protein